MTRWQNHRRYHSEVKPSIYGLTQEAQQLEGRMAYPLTQRQQEARGGYWSKPPRSRWPFSWSFIIFSTRLAMSLTLVLSVCSSSGPVT